MIIGIDASNIGGGGGITHLKEILLAYNSELFQNKIDAIVVFSSQHVLNELPDIEILRKVTFKKLNKGLLQRVLFQLTQYDKEIRKRCDILFSVTGDYIGNFKPVVGMSRNMLLYERDIWKEIKQPKEVIRFWLNYKKQQRSFKNSDGVIFISNYAKKYINNIFNLEGKTIDVINHGVSQRFSNPLKKHKLISEFTLESPFKFIYVSSIHVYKHQWNVVKAVANIRSLGYPVELHLIGSVIFAAAGEKLAKTINEVDPSKKFIKNHGHVKYDMIDSYYKESNGIVFASTCENMPNTLIESMASGTPIACSNKEPMPEFLKNKGYYFDSYDVDSIQSALEKLMFNVGNNDMMVTENLEEVKKYNWKKTSEKTFDFLINSYNSNI